MRLIGLNKDEIVVGELLGQLWRNYKENALPSSTGSSKLSDDEGEAMEDMAEVAAAAGEESDEDTFTEEIATRIDV